MIKKYFKYQDTTHIKATEAISLIDLNGLFGGWQNTYEEMKAIAISEVADENPFFVWNEFGK